MAELNINGRMSVKNFKKQFQEAFGCSPRVYAGKHFADENQTLASLREEGKKGDELSVKGNMLVGNFEAKMLEEYGITVQVANIDDTKLVDNSLTLAAAGRGEERKATKKTEKVTSAKQFKLLKDLKENDTLYYYWSGDSKIYDVKILKISNSFGDNAVIRVKDQEFYFTYDKVKCGNKPIGNCTIYLQRIFYGAISTDLNLLKSYRDGNFDNSI